MRRSNFVPSLAAIALFAMTTTALAVPPTPVLVDPEQKLSNTNAELTLNAGDLFGSGVAVIGDVDNNGVDDLAVGAEGTDGAGLSASGAVWILLMNADGTIMMSKKVDASTAIMAGLLSADDEFGTSVAAAGDLDGNGVPDVIAGAPNEDAWDSNGDNTDGGFGINRGAIYILYLNSKATVIKVQKIDDTDPVLAIPNNSDLFGDAVTSLGDLDGAGGSDVAIACGAPGDRIAGFLTGAVHILFMTYNATTSCMDVDSVVRIAEGSNTPASFDLTNSVTFGNSLGSLDDFTGDGRRELVVGSVLDDDGGVGIAINRGAVYVMYPDATGAITAFQKISDTEGGFTGTLEDSDFFGDSVAGLKDLDCDGTPELVVGTQGDDDGGAGRGAAYLLFLSYNGGTGALTVKHHEKISDIEGDFDATLNNDDMFGTSVGASDLDSNGNPEILIGAQGDDTGAGSAGAVHVAHLAITLDTPKTVAITNDLAFNMLVNPGDEIEYTIVVTNLGYVKAEGVTFEDVIGANQTYVAGSVSSTRGTASFDGTRVIVTGIGNLTPQTTNPADDDFTVTFRVTVDQPFPAGESSIENQGFVKSDNLPGGEVGTDDPMTVELYDPTVTTVKDDPVPVRLAAFSVARSGADAVLQWDVAEATNHLGFHVYREESGASRVQVNDLMLTGQDRYTFVDENAPRDAVNYWLSEISRDGNAIWHGPFTLSQAPPIASVLTMAPAQPNPFSASTRIAYSVPDSRKVNLTVYDVLGRQVAVLVDETQAPGQYTVNWDGRTDTGGQAVIGLYIMRLQAGGESQIQKAILSR